MKKAMHAWLHPVEGSANEWTWDKAEPIFVDPKTDAPVDWRNAVMETAREMDWKLSGYDFSTIEGLAALACWEPILVPDLCVLENYKGFINKVPAGAVVMGDIDEVPTALIWEEEYGEA